MAKLTFACVCGTMFLHACAVDMTDLLKSMQGDAGSQGDGGHDIGKLFESLGSLGAGGKGGGGKTNSICPDKQLAAPKLLSALEPGTLIANGCGPQGMQVKEEFGLWRCCNRHDVCFSSCDISFSFCESMFKKCMKERCAMPENHGKGKECEQQASSFSSITAMFGQMSFSNSMKMVCDCLDTENEVEARRREWVADVYQRFAPVEKRDNATQIIDSLLSKYKGKQGKLYFDLIQKYGTAEGFVAFDKVGADFSVDGPSADSAAEGEAGEVGEASDGDKASHTEL